MDSGFDWEELSFEGWVKEEIPINGEEIEIEMFDEEGYFRL